jgi:hypothetical protein
VKGFKYASTLIIRFAGYGTYDEPMSKLLLDSGHFRLPIAAQSHRAGSLWVRPYLKRPPFHSRA